MDEEHQINNVVLYARKKIGRMSRKTINTVLKRDNHKCLKCGRTKNLEIHHLPALMYGGNNDIANLAILCHDCHKYAPDTKAEFEEFIKRHLSPFAESSSKLTKIIVEMILNRYGLIDRNPGGPDNSEELLSIIMEKIDRIYDMSWESHISEDITKFSENVKEIMSK